MRNHFNEVNDKGEKKQLAAGDKPSREKFLDACQEYDFLSKGVITLTGLLTAFSRARIKPLPSREETVQLMKALEVFTNDEGEEVYYRKILEAHVSRETQSINNIFPKIVSRL